MDFNTLILLFSFILIINYLPFLYTFFLFQLPIKVFIYPNHIFLLSKVMKCSQNHQKTTCSSISINILCCRDMFYEILQIAHLLILYPLFQILQGLLFRPLVIPLERFLYVLLLKHSVYHAQNCQPGQILTRLSRAILLLFFHDFFF